MVRQIILAWGAVIVLAASASAQSPVYVGGTGFAEMKMFGETESSLVPDIEGSELDGTSPGGGVRIGTFLHPRWSLELAIDTAAKTESTQPSYPYILANVPNITDVARLRAPDFNQSISFLTVSTVAGYHPAPRGRFRPGYLFGLAFVTSTFKSQYPNYYPLATQALSYISLPSGVVSTILPPPGVLNQTITTTHNSTGVLLGFETAIDFGRHLSVVPEVRALSFSSPNSGGTFLIRPGAGVRWRF